MAAVVFVLDECRDARLPVVEVFAELPVQLAFLSKRASLPALTPGILFAEANLTHDFPAAQ